MAAIMLILSASACILCSYRRCSNRGLTHRHQRTSSQLVIKDTRHHHHVLLMRPSRSSMQPNIQLHSSAYAQMGSKTSNASKNGSEWLVVTQNQDHSDDSALTV